MGNGGGRSNKGILVSQRMYVMDLLKETRMLGCTPADTPMDQNSKLRTKEDGVCQQMKISKSGWKTHLPFAY